MATLAAEEGAITEEEPRYGFEAPENISLGRLSQIISLGWLGTNLGIAVADLPLRFLLKDTLHLTAVGVSGFFFWGNFTNYIKPLAGLLTDSYPLFGSRRKSYLLLSLIGSGLLWMLLSIVPRRYGPLLCAYAILYLTIVFTSTTLGGVMVEIGQRFRAEGRLTAQRIAMFRLGALFGGPIGGELALYPFPIAMFAAAALHLVLVPLYVKYLPPEKPAPRNPQLMNDALRQVRLLVTNKTMVSAAAMVFLLAVSPGFGTPLLFHQTDQMHISKPHIGWLTLVGSGFGLIGAGYYFRYCRKYTVKRLLIISIVLHAIGTLLYLMYSSWHAAIVITAITGITGALAMLPVYDLAVRATPKGCEAIGYAVMMSVWNLTNALSDVSGSTLYHRFGLTFAKLVWVNAGTTLLILVAVPILPKALLATKDGHHVAETVVA